MKKILPILILSLIFLSACENKDVPIESSNQASDIIQTAADSRTLLSPDSLKVLSAKWQGASMILYVADVAGYNEKKVAEQSVPEGSGELDVDSLRWLDDEHIQYSESGLICPEKKLCELPADFVIKKLTYKVNVASLQKELVQEEVL